MFAFKQTETNSTADLDIVDLTRLLWKQKWSIFAVSFVSICIVIFTCLIITPKFDASTMLVVGQTNLEGLPDAARRTAETNLSLVQIAKSDDVIREAIEQVGLSQLAGPTIRRPFVQTLRDLPGVRNLLSVFSERLAQSQVTALDRAVPIFSKALTVTLAPNSDIIRITFRHKDPATAVKFANAVAQSFVDRQLDLLKQPGTEEFYQRQKDKFDGDLRKASDALDAFVTANGTYSIGSQIQLLLTRNSNISAALAATRGLIADKTGQKDKLAAQLRQLKPVTQSPFVSSLVDTLGGDDDHSEKSAGSALPKPLSSRDERRVADAPPLLMVRVYQETMVALFKVNADLQGLANLQTEQAEEVERLNRALRGLSSKKAELERLTQAVTQASLNADTYAKRKVTEQINAESIAAKFSMVKIIQRASVPIKPSFPNYPLVVGFGLGGSIVASIAVALILGLWSGYDLVQHGPPFTPHVPPRSKGSGSERRRRSRRSTKPDEQSFLSVP